jgi:hypothetical protein
MVVVDAITRIAHLRGLRNKDTDCSDQEFGCMAQTTSSFMGHYHPSVLIPVLYV